MRRAGGIRLAVTLVMAAGLGLRAPAATAAVSDQDVELGIRLLDQGEWGDALPLYQRITREDPNYPWGWLGLGWSLHYTGNPAAALPAYRRARQLGALDDHRLLLEMARAQLQLGRRDSALAYLRLSVEEGEPNLARLATDEKLAGLRSEPEFRELLGLLDSTGVTRESGWRHDLRLLEREIGRVRVDPWHSLSAADLASGIARLEGAVDSLDDDQLAAGVMRLVVRLGDGHTRAVPRFMRAGEPQLPVLFGQFDDGLFVTATDSARTGLLWAEVLEINGRAAARVTAALEPLAPRDNPIRLKSVVAPQLRYPRLLRAVGLGDSRDTVVLGVRDRAGRRRTVRLAAAPPVTAPWIRVPAGEGRTLPLYGQHRATYYWFEPLADSTLYFQYNVCDDSDSESVEAFAKRLLARLDQPDIARLVVDLRWNGGGNLMVNGPLLEAIVQSRAVNRPGHLFVIASRHTFSAAMSFAAQLDRFTHATFVGEPTGSSPNFIGETTRTILPYTGIDLSLSNRYWQNSHAMDHRVWIPPRIPVPWTFASYREGRDPMLEAIRRSVH